ncbi:PREDICTED: mite group 2 allergen Tyr p 2-like [Rhagoletis zephyria]|uniref:mite group 2 allergen Tyr p 2-like n=1 Tax=Rhagoletis zephyria TaxID=28612 RepID=UPI000811242A|nr:PREDICTED: mite group 2 allergen Tyr p 2-like [Rhagoletis zephyria]
MKFLILFALVAVAAAGEVKFHDCGHNEITKVEVDGCSGELCTLHKSKPVHLKSTFTANQDTTKIELKITGKLNGIEVAVPGVETDGCKIVKCPLKKGQTVPFEYTFTIPAIVPAVPDTMVTLKAVGDHGVLACASVHNKIEN